MSKRRPGTELTHDNWDDEEESEEAGTFSHASKKTLEKREIKKAKRKGTTMDESNGESKPSVFKGFTGFAPTSAFTATSFNFKVTASSTTTTSAAPAPSFGAIAKQSSSDQTSKYLHQLKSLNLSVTKWISEHVDTNPYCILSPIFKDYEKHLAELEKKYPDHSKDTTAAEKKVVEAKDEKPKEESDKKTEEKKDTAITSPPTTAFTFKAAATSNTATSNSATSSSLFSGFGGGATKPLGASSSSTGIFGGFGKTDGAAAATSGFTFAATKATSDAASTSKGANGDGGNEEDEYVPPKNEVETVKEDDAYYTKRCKLYYKKGEAWADRGVGNLHLKKCEDKTVLLIRADTSLGNILLNILLSGAIPANRQGKNNVMISCVPNPPIDEKNKDDKTPVSMLLRVKTGEDADELFEKIKDAKESS